MIKLNNYTFILITIIKVKIFNARLNINRLIILIKIYWYIIK